MAFGWLTVYLDALIRVLAALRPRFLAVRQSGEYEMMLIVHNSVLRIQDSEIIGLETRMQRDTVLP